MAFSIVILCPRLLIPSSRSSALVSSGRWTPRMSFSTKVLLYCVMFIESNQSHTSSQLHSNTGLSRNDSLKQKGWCVGLAIRKLAFRVLKWNTRDRKRFVYWRLWRRRRLQFFLAWLYALISYFHNLQTTYQTNTKRPPTEHPHTDHLPTDHPPTTYRPPTDHLPTDHPPTTYRSPTNRPPFLRCSLFDITKSPRME